VNQFRRFALTGLGLSLIFSLASAARAEQYPESAYQEMLWRMIGPFRGGRTRAVAGVPSQPNVFYIGQVNGGVWKSDDYGRTWTPIFDAEPTQSIGAIAVAPSDPNIVYVASGEGLQRPDLSVGDGIYKSADAGKTWVHLGLRDGRQIPQLAVDPRDTNRVFAAVLGHPYGPNEERGIFRSADGGQTWQKVLYKDANTGGSDVEIDPSNPEVVYASLWEARQGPWEYGNDFEGTGGGLFKSTDGGSTWRPLGHGLPGDVTQINLAIAASQPSRLYATLATKHDPHDYQSGEGLGVYRSDDAGESWVRATRDPRPAMRIGGGDLPVPKADPKNPDVVYSASIVTWRSTDGGRTWTGIRGAPGGDDYQNLWINPLDPNIILLVSDQGAIVTVNGGDTWSSWYNQPTAQLYHAAVTATFPYRVCGGQQESGSVCISSRGNDGEITFRDWHPVGVIEYGYVAPDPLHPDIIYGAGTNSVTRYDTSTGQVENITPIPMRGGKYRVDRTQPIVFSPLDPKVLYYAANVLFKTTDGGHSWQAISPDLARPNPGIPANLGQMDADDNNASKPRGVIYSLALSSKSAGTIWAGTDDGLIWATRDGARNWNNITPPGLAPWSKVTQLDASHFDDQTVYASVSRFRIDDLHPYIYRTHDGGKTWSMIVSGLPDNAPVDTVREDPVRKGLLFAGTENAVWVSFDDGDHWQSLQLNLPHTSMRDLCIHDNALIVATHGRSFWILDDITPLRQLSESAVRSAALLFKPEVAYRVRRDTNTDTPLPPDEPAGENPPAGAIIDYILAQPADGPVTIEILDRTGKVVRRTSSADPPELTEAELKAVSVPLYWLRAPQTPGTGAGMHRWVWNLHYPAPKSTRHEYPIAAIPHATPRRPLGPRALPGEYSVRLAVDGHTSTAPLTVKLDPRVKTTAAELEQQFHLATRLSVLMTASYAAVTQAQSVHEQLDKLAQQASGGTAESVKVLQKKVAELLGGRRESANAKPEVALRQLDREIATLYGDLDGVDAPPTVVQTATADAIEREAVALMKRWNEIKTTGLAALNQELRRASLPEVRPDTASEARPEPDQNADED